MAENKFELSLSHLSTEYVIITRRLYTSIPMNLVHQWQSFLFVAGIHFFEWINKNNSSFRWMKEYYLIVGIIIS